MTLRSTLLAATALVLSVGSADASIIANLDGITNSATHANAFDYTYSSTLAANEQIVTGSYLVLYDWGPALNPIPTAATGYMATNFGFAQVLVGPTPIYLLPPDSASVLNVVATYTGPTLSGYLTGDGATGNLGTFVLTSPFGGSTPNGYQASQAQHFNPSGVNTGDPDSNLTTTTIPAAIFESTLLAISAPLDVPEPASLALLGGALALAGLIRRRQA